MIASEMTFAELADPATIPESIRMVLRHVDPDAPHPLNLFRVHWYNDASRRGSSTVPDHVELPESLFESVTAMRVSPSTRSIYRPLSKCAKHVTPRLSTARHAKERID